MNFPKTLNTHPIPSNIKKRILMENEDFIDLVINDKFNIVFCCYQSNSKISTYLYVIKEGIFFYTDSYILETFEDLHKAHVNFEESGFKNHREYMGAVKFDIKNYEEYLKCKNIGFLDLKDDDSYINYLNFKKGGFTNKNEYLEAKRHGIKTNEEYQAFEDSGYNNYEAYLDAKKLGFKYKEDYDKAMRLGIKNIKEYQEFLDSACKTRKEFEFFKKIIPQLIKNMLKNIDEILRDANKNFESNRFEDFVRLKFLSLERMSKLLYLKIFRKELRKEDDFKIDDIVNQIEEKIEREIVDYEELKYWRRIRNKIVHENEKIEKDKAEKGKEFFDEFYSGLKKIFDTYKI